MKPFLTFLLVLLFLGCGGAPRPSDVDVELKKPTEKKLSTFVFENALTHFREKNWEKAEVELYSFLQLYPESRFYLAAWVAYGETLQYRGLFEDSVEAFRRVVSRVHHVRPELRARSSLSLSFSYEMLNENEKALTALLDARSIKSGLNEIQMDFLVPARMATIYARLGNRRLAERFAKEAHYNVKKVRGRGFQVANERYLLADLLYRMGRNPIGAQFKGDILDVIYGLQVSQEFLLQSLELGVEEFSESVERELTRAYDELWKAFQSDEQSEMKEKWAVALLEAMDRFRMSRLPAVPDVSEKPMQRVLTQFDQLEGKLFSWIANNSVRVTRTNENQNRTGLRREGRIIDASELEKMTRKPYKLIDLDAELSKDPNL